jgi:hypothetical protein
MMEVKYMTVVLELPADEAERAATTKAFPLFGSVAGATVVGLAHGNAIREAELLEVAAGRDVARRAKRFVNEVQDESEVERIARLLPPEQRTVDALAYLRPAE